MKYIIGADSITAFVQGKPYTINKQAQTYGLVLKAIKENNEQALLAAVNIRQGIADSLSKGNNNVKISGNKIFYADVEVTGLIASRIFEVIRLGLDTKPMTAFLENLMQNPSKRAVDGLFGFLDACRLPITEDGHFLAYKRVREDYKDCHSGTMDNSVGKIVSMQRNQVDDNKDQTCSYGLHACSYSYLKHFGGARIVVVKINPADVVSVPTDYNNAKLRCCKYEVVEEIPLNEFKLPSYELDSGYTTKHATKEEEKEVWPFSTASESVNPSAKLTTDDVIAIRKYWADEDEYSENQAIAFIMTNWNISRRQAWRIVNNEAWKNV
jgi:hypothetical protein